MVCGRLLIMATDSFIADFMQKIVEKLADNAQLTAKYWQGTFSEGLPNLVKKGIDTIMEFFHNVEPGAWDNLIESYSNQGLFTQEQGNRLKQLKDLSSPMDLVAFVWLSIQLFLQLLQINVDAGGNYLRQQLNEQLRPNLPDPMSIIQAAFIAPEKTGQVRDVMRKAGLPEEMQDLLFLSGYRLYNEDVVRQLFLRKVLTKDETIMRLRELGYTDTRIQELIKTWEIIPPVQDILTMVGHEAFEPDSIALLGLDLEFPEEQAEWLEKQGLTRYWQEKYWISHWEEPGIQTGYEMFHRQDPDNPGHTIIDESVLDMLYRTVEIPKYWREKLTKIAYQPYTRVDVRRMHQLGVLSDNELYWSYRDLGYDDIHAQRMSEFTVDYNNGTGKDLSQAQVLKAYKMQLITRNESILLLGQLKFTEERADFLLTLTDFDREMEYQQDVIDDIKIRYQDNLIDANEARDKLGALNLTGSAIDLYMNTWEVKRLSNQKKPSKTDLDKFLKAKIITSNQYRLELQKLGYGYEYVDWYEQLASKS
jgi:hypothetical protein